MEAFLRNIEEMLKAFALRVETLTLRQRGWFLQYYVDGYDDTERLLHCFYISIGNSKKA